MKIEDLRKVEKIILISVIVLVLIGISEIIVGSFINSIGLVADGVDSISDSVISFMVWFGLKISRRHADKRFHFGYYRVETLVSMIVATIMIIMSLFIFYSAYLRLRDPVEINYPAIGMVTLIIAGLISLYLSIIKNKIASDYSLLSVKADAKASIKDSTSSFVILAGIILYSLGFKWGDALGAFIIGIYIISVAVATIKGASLVLIDGFNNPQLIRDISAIIGKHPNVKLKELRLRMSGPYIIGEIFVTVNKEMTVGHVFNVKNQIRNHIMNKISGVKDLIILADPESIL